MFDGGPVGVACQGGPVGVACQGGPVGVACQSSEASVIVRFGMRRVRSRPSRSTRLPQPHEPRAAPVTALHWTVYPCPPPPPHRPPLPPPPPLLPAWSLTKHRAGGYESDIFRKKESDVSNDEAQDEAWRAEEVERRVVQFRLEQRFGRLVVAGRGIEPAAWCENLPAGANSRRRDCHFADALSPSPLKDLLNVEGGCSRLTVSPTARCRAPRRGWSCDR